MKKIILCAFVAASLLVACKEDPAKAAAKDASAKTADASEDGKAADDKAAKPSKADSSYAFGMAIGTSLKQTGVSLDYAAFTKGLKDVLEGKKTKVTMEEASGQIQTAVADAGEKLAADAIEKEKKFLADNGKKPNIKTTASGLQYEVITEGTGLKPLPTDTVKVNYIGTLVGGDGKPFDSTVDRGEPAVFPLNQVIPGWQEAIQLMPVGGKYRFFIPSELAYGAQGAAGVIGPNATLIFEVDLIGIEPPAAPAKK
jgi:FKBP-type peptidyl-prolyl cis-trans isomerase